MRPGIRAGLSAIEKREVWSRWKQGQSLHAIGRAFEHPVLELLSKNLFDCLKRVGIASALGFSHLGKRGVLDASF